MPSRAYLAIEPRMQLVKPVLAVLSPTTIHAAQPAGATGEPPGSANAPRGLALLGCDGAIDVRLPDSYATATPPSAGSRRSAPDTSRQLPRLVMPEVLAPKAYSFERPGCFEILDVPREESSGLCE